MKTRAWSLLLGVLLTPAWADGPAFDRPGIAFSTSTLAPGTYTWEQGLPDLTRDRADGVRTTQYSADTLVRAGLGANVELQLGTSIYNRLRDSSGTSASGYGDTSVALKVALPTHSERYSWALLAGVGLPSGQEPFTSGATQASLATTAAYALSDAQALSFFASLEHGGGHSSWRVSPSWGWSLADGWSVYSEAGLTHAEGNNDYIAGGGVTWMVLTMLQLDLYADGGLTRNSTDLTAGAGLSYFFDAR